jgi:TolA-binding protein
LLVATVALGCAVQKPLQSVGPAAVDVLAELPPTVTVAESASRPAPSEDDVVAGYRTVLGSAPDAVNDSAIARRLADLELRSAERADATDTNAYREAIALYEALLVREDVQDRDQIVYRLARSHEIVGDVAAARRYLDRLIEEFPYSEYAVEAHFRRAEALFSADQFAPAARDYSYVIGQGAGGTYWQNASYMLAWAQFRLSQPAASLESFLNVLPSTLTGDEVKDRASQELLDDILRGVVLAVGELDGAQTLAIAMASRNRPVWQYRVYERLARELADKGRYLDSVAAIEAFIESNPMDWRAAVFEQRAIATLVSAEFSTDARKHKELFVARYGLDTDYWRVYSNDSRNDYRPVLKTFLVDLARFSHADGQQSGRAKDYAKAARYYEQFVAAFPNDSRVPETLFLLGETYTESKAFEQAVAAFQRVARDFPEYQRAGEAAYAAVLALSRLVDATPAGHSFALVRRKIEAEVAYAEAFPEHPHAAEALTAAAVATYDLGDYAAGMDLADRLIALPKLPSALRRTALLVSGQSAFELGRFAQAERAYRAHHLLGGAAADEQTTVTAKLLAAIYRQGEQAEAAGDRDAAVAHFLRLVAVDESAELAVQGMFDAVAIREEEGRWLDAARLLQDLRSRYAQHQLARDATRRLANFYEHASEWSMAAAEFMRLSVSDADVAIRRQALYRAGELYLDVDRHAALGAFSKYAEIYGEPVDVALEAMRHAAELTEQEGDVDAYRGWLHSIVAAVQSVAEPTQRSRFLAAQAEFVFAEDARAAFAGIALDTPMVDALKRKQRALKEAVAAYERAAGYGVAEYATASTYNIAEIYAALAQAILTSKRPRGLSELELAQYDLLLEEQAIPFEEQAIAIHELNARRSWNGVYDDWVKRSFTRLRVLLPARFDKDEVRVGAIDSMR